MNNGTRWVGIDLHRKRSHVAVIDEQGELTVSRRIMNDRETFLELLGDPAGETHVALEATYGWEWLAELLEDAGYDVHLAHPLRRAIAAARVKTDAIDAKTLAHLLRGESRAARAGRCGRLVSTVGFAVYFCPFTPRLAVASTI